MLEGSFQSLGRHHGFSAAAAGGIEAVAALTAEARLTADLRRSGLNTAGEWRRVDPVLFLSLQIRLDCAAAALWIRSNPDESSLLPPLVL